MSVQLVGHPCRTLGTLVVVLSGVLGAAAGCVIDPADSVPDTAARTSAIESGPGPCGIGGDVLSVERLTPAARLQLLLSAARAASPVGPSCGGIFDQIALSTTDADAIVDLVNAASANELHGVLAFLINQGVVGTLTTGRPFASAGAISQVAGVGPAVLRALRNTANFRGPFEDLAQAINAVDQPGGEIRVATHFDWVPIVTRAERFTDMTCFGIGPALLPPGAALRAQLANSNEVMESAGEAVALASNIGQLSVSSTPGLTDLEARLAGGSFLGCYISSQPNPFVFDQQSFFVNSATGASVMFTQHFVE
jgi:hypothetical protein